LERVNGGRNDAEPDTKKCEAEAPPLFQNRQDGGHTAVDKGGGDKNPSPILEREAAVCTAADPDTAQHTVKTLPTLPEYKPKTHINTESRETHDTRLPFLEIEAGERTASKPNWAEHMQCISTFVAAGLLVFCSCYKNEPRGGRPASPAPSAKLL